MKILQAGLPKSGNFWLSHIIRAIYSEYHLSNPSYIVNQPIFEVSKTWIKSVNRADGKALDVIEIEPNGCFIIIDTMYRELIEDFDAYVSQCSHVWTHSAMCNTSFTILPKFDKVVYVLRDPRDVLISKSQFIFTPYMMKQHPHSFHDPETFLSNRIVSSTRQWMRHVGGYLAYANQMQIHIMFYERMKHDLRTEIISLIEYLGLEPVNSILDNIQAQVSLEHMKSENPIHVREGKVGGWRNTLTKKQQDKVLRTARPMLKLLNYPLKAEDDQIPRMPAHYTVEEVKRAVTPPPLSRVWTFVRGSARSLIKPDDFPEPKRQ